MTADNAFVAMLDQSHLRPWRSALTPQLERIWQTAKQGTGETWLGALAALPPCVPSSIDLNADAVGIGTREDIDDDRHARVHLSLEQLHPWRKGPFSFFDIHIDTEWRSDLKWARVVPHIQPLTGRNVLDVGCGSGYHCWRMRGAGAASVLGIEPSLLYCAQFLATQRYIQDPAVNVLPVRCEDLPANTQPFDTVFSMGVIYHRRSPLDHLSELRGLLRPGGELVLETLVVTGDERTLLMPKERYARMRNVWFIPSVAMLQLWLQRSGFRDVRAVDITVTSVDEQRSTPWMRFESLSHALDPEDPTRTVEGLPAPTRAVVIANAR